MKNDASIDVKSLSRELDSPKLCIPNFGVPVIFPGPLLDLHDGTVWT